MTFPPPKRGNHDLFGEVAAAPITGADTVVSVLVTGASCSSVNFKSPGSDIDSPISSSPVLPLSFWTSMFAEVGMTVEGETVVICEPSSVVWVVSVAAAEGDEKSYTARTASGKSLLGCCTARCRRTEYHPCWGEPPSPESLRATDFQSASTPTPT